MITIYSTAHCAFCKTEKQWLESLGYKYTSKMVDSDSNAMEELKALGIGTAVPVTVVNSTIVRGFDRPSLLAALTAA